MTIITKMYKPKEKLTSTLIIKWEYISLHL